MYPRGVVDNVLVQVNDLVFLANFYILDMENEASYKPTPTLLGRPFLKTARAMINVYEGLVTMEFDGEVIKFNLFEEIKYRSAHVYELESSLEPIHYIKE